MSKPIIAVAGGTGNLGGRIVKALIERGAEVRVLVRTTSDAEKIGQLEKLGAKVLPINMTSEQEIATACSGASCVVSALAGLKEVVIDTQKTLLNGVVLAGVPRFIPSDYSLDFTKFNDGENRNLDLRRAFHTYLDAAPIEATTIFNGAFMDMLTAEFPMIIFKRKLIIYWGNVDHKLAFTTLDNTAEFTANVALDTSTPRYLSIAGDQISPRETGRIMEELTGQKFRLFRLGGLGLLSLLIKIAKKLAPGKTEIYPAYQGMQYMRNMIDKRGLLKSTDNNRYPEVKWTTVEDFLVKNIDSK
ncbi:NmrA family NAD(P)-binding protein [Chryseobacterium gotjawalense]|uniref:NmrA family NAD(P)-binding protein n=1 Tax=Chryseobacterium gotjawalense TaxID=3042315 RepID=A0ABY8REE4_9FLAO|nr:NmrA family NAD(P)-binding protein [Chryseobacterium sp. wdc7]WHF51558.1 NmrA family NAD(P)-binding protein [Chryseobacterium sp. wdc7]